VTRFEPGFLDKLFDDDARGPASPVLRSHSIGEMKNAVARDIEALLNTRMVFTDEALEGFPECERSVVTFGLNDFSGRSLASHDDREFVCSSIRNAIDRHEKRLSNVSVTLMLDSQSDTQVLYFGITALLTLSHLQEPVQFDATLQPTTLQYSVSRGVGKARNDG